MLLVLFSSFDDVASHSPQAAPLNTMANVTHVTRHEQKLISADYMR